jgi:probable rRNA maturation factor
MVKITIKNLQNKVTFNSHQLKRMLNETLKNERVKRDGEITLSFINDITMRKLNKKYLKKDYSTDVLAFDITSPKEKRLCADILISTDTAVKNASRFRTTPAFELNLYSIHGLLHILGYDDHSLKDRAIMRKKEAEYVHT